MRKREEYQAKVTDDGGLVRGRVPCPLLNEMGARHGDRLIFRLGDAGEATVRVARLKVKSGKGSRKAQGGKRR